MKLIHIILSITFILSFVCLNKLPAQQINLHKSPTFTLQDFYTDNDTLDFIVEEVFKTLNDRQRMGQMIVSVGGRSGYPVYKLEEMVVQTHLGGMLLLSGSKSELKKLPPHFNHLSRHYGSLPLLFSADAEPSLINRKISGLPTFPKTNTLQTDKEVKEVAKGITEVLHELSILQNFAPVADFNVNTSIIGNRSFGKDAETVKHFATLFSQTTQAENIVATAKHFPGHGNVKGDSHKQLVYIDGKIQELSVFEELVRQGIVSVMIGHIAIKNNPDYDTDGEASSCSKMIITHLLKGDLGFDGIVITDSMKMGAVSRDKDNAFKALFAGCDMVLMPVDEWYTHEKLLETIEKNKGFKAQAYASVKKIIRLKLCLGIIHPALYMPIRASLMVEAW